jgi:hypothetical protein
MSSPAQDLAHMLSDARVVILITEAHPDGLVLHPTNNTVTVQDDES